MLKNKLLIFILVGLFSTIANSQNRSDPTSQLSINEMMRAANDPKPKLPVKPPQPSVQLSNPLVPGSPLNTLMIPTQRNLPSLISTLSSNSGAIAEFEFNGINFYLGKNGSMKDGWIVKNINLDNVELEQCDAVKKCKLKTLKIEGN